MAERLTEEQRRLVAAASRYQETEDRNAMERALARQDQLDISTYVVEAPCSVCGEGSVQVHPRWIHAARCGRCIQDGREAPRAPMSDDREPTISWERLRAPYVPEAAAPEGIAKHPEPAVRASDPVPEGVEPPAAVRGLQGRAEGLGWSVNVTYARGNGVHATTGKPTKLVDSWAVRCWRGRKRAVAVYTAGTWGDMWGIEHMFHARTLEQFTTYLFMSVNDTPEGLAGWVAWARDENTAFEARKPCASGEIHGEHFWENTKGARLYCLGRKTEKVKKTKEAGG